MFNKCFLVVRVEVDPEPILGILDVREEYTTDEIPVHRRANTLQ